MITLEPYQQLAKEFLIKNDRAALFMAMGLGKTATTLSTLHDLMLDGACTGALIVAPLRVATLTWPHEVQRWFPNLRIANLRTVDWQSLGLNFVLVFSPGAFRGAPLTHVATVSLPGGGTTQEEAALLDAVAQRFPGVTPVPVKEAISALSSSC